MGPGHHGGRQRFERRDASRLDDATEIEAAWVVGADGAHSVVRKAMGVGFPGVPLVERFLLADVHADLDRPRECGDHVAARGPGCWPRSRCQETTCGG